MVPWELLDSARVPGASQQLTLWRRGAEYSIRVDGSELMNSRVHASEDALGRRGCAELAATARPCVLLGGLGMGFTLAAALAQLSTTAEVIVAELFPAVVRWNREHLGALAGHPLLDARVQVREQDVGELIRGGSSKYDAILLDVDNGPDALTNPGNKHIYSGAGLKRAREALRPGGRLSLWSAKPSVAFTRRLHGAGFEVTEERVRARGPKGGSQHTLWLADAPKS